MNIIINPEDGSATIPRIEFVKSLLEGLGQSLSEDFATPLVIKNSNMNTMIFSPEKDLEDEVVNIGDQDSLEIMTVAFIIIGAVNYTLPKIIFHLELDTEFDGITEDDGQEAEAVIVGVELHDFSGKIISYGDQGKYSVELGCNYLKNSLQMNGIISMTSRDSKPKDLIVTKNESDINHLFENSLEAFESGPTLASMMKRHRTKAVRMKALTLNRRKDRSGFIKRSRAAKLRWRKHRGKIVRGMNKFHDSSRGKRQHKLLSQLNKRLN